MMNQPELGRKIAELRKAKGLTQEELVEKCNLSVRTLQRIESGEVTPRSYTIRQIFSALDYEVYNSVEGGSNNTSNISNWLRQAYRYVIDLFNLKTNTMKKITILVITGLIVAFGLFALCSESKAQKAEKVQKIIESHTNKINEWVNRGEIDSIMTMYRDDACVLPSIKGKNEIREMIKSAIDKGYKIKEDHALSVSIGDSIAVQKDTHTCIYSGSEFKQTGMTEWRLTNGKWLIVFDIILNE